MEFGSIADEKDRKALLEHRGSRIPEKQNVRLGCRFDSLGLWSISWKTGRECFEASVG